LNGVEVFEHSFARPARAFGVNVVLDLARGTNEVVVTAKDASGASQNVRRLVEFR
jgi:hypothetical protein